MRRFTLLMPLFMQLFISRILLLSLCSLRPVLLYRRPDLFQAAVSLALAASEGVLVDLERVDKNALGQLLSGLIHTTRAQDKGGGGNSGAAGRNRHCARQV